MTSGTTAPGDPQRRAAIGPETWLDHPNNRFSLTRASEFVPSALWTPAPTVQPASTVPSLLDRMLVPGPGGHRIPLPEHLQATHADSLLLFEAGDLVAEWHAPGIDPNRPHLLFSIGKSITGVLAGILIGDGVLDTDASVESLVPALRGTATGAALVRHMLDMTVDLAYTETFDGSPSDFTRYRRAVWGHGPETLLDVAADMAPGPDGHGTVFRYVTPVTDILGIAIEAATGQRYVDLLGDRLFAPLGLTGPVVTQVDRQGRARATGGISMTPRDLARLGQCLLDGGRAADGRQVVPGAWIDDMRQNGDRGAWLRGDCPEVLPDGAYRSLWYAEPGGEFFATGIFGQFLWCDPRTGRMIVRTASRQVASDVALTVAELAILRAIAAQDWTVAG